MKTFDFKPTSSCNMIYKIASKVLANRLKLVLQSFIPKNQNTFLLGRLITDNILKAYEFLDSTKTKQK